jgi:ATP/maltotriose-dependent transcriptional regulator MalT
MESASSTALEQATALGEDALIAGASAVRAASRFHHGDFPAARDLADAAADLVRGADTSAAPVAWLDTLFHLGMSGVFMERYSRATGHLGQALDIARATGAEQLYVESAAGRAAAQTELGLLADARESADAAVDAARLSNNPQKLAWGLMARATVATAEGALDGALRDGAEAVEIARTVEAPTIASGVATAAAGALIEAGDHAAAVEVLTGLQGGEGLELVFPTRHALACRLLTRAELGRANPAAARAWAERAAAYAAQNDLAMPSAHAALAEAAVLLAEGEPGRAAERAEHAVSLCESVGAVLEAARAQLLAGQALAAAGDRERAGDHLRSAEAAFARIGAGRLRDQTVRELRAIGRRVARAGRRGDLAAGGLAALSGREREVADLVRDRLTNRQIGAELFLSEKTVETHLRNVFVKLGVDSRVAVARMLEEAAAP